MFLSSPVSSDEHHRLTHVNINESSINCKEYLTMEELWDSHFGIHVPNNNTSQHIEYENSQ